MQAMNCNKKSAWQISLQMVMVSLFVTCYTLALLKCASGFEVWCVLGGGAGAQIGYLRTGAFRGLELGTVGGIAIGPLLGVACLWLGETFAW